MNIVRFSCLKSLSISVLLSGPWPTVRTNKRKSLVVVPPVSTDSHGRGWRIGPRHPPHHPLPGCRLRTPYAESLSFIPCQRIQAPPPRPDLGFGRLPGFHLPLFFGSLLIVLFIIVKTSKNFFVIPLIQNPVYQFSTKAGNPKFHRYWMEVIGHCKSRPIIGYLDAYWMDVHLTSNRY